MKSTSRLLILCGALAFACGAIHRPAVPAATTVRPQPTQVRPDQPVQDGESGSSDVKPVSWGEDETFLT